MPFRENFISVGLENIESGETCMTKPTPNPHQTHTKPTPNPHQTQNLSKSWGGSSA